MQIVVITSALKDSFFSEYFIAELVIGHAGRKMLKPRHKESVFRLTVLVAAWAFEQQEQAAFDR